jgi:adenylate kinase family enzyme
VIDLVASASICKKRLLGRAQRSERDDDAESKLDKRLEGYESRGKAIARQLKEENQNTYHEVRHQIREPCKP